MLRDPDARLVSSYRHILRTPTHRDYREVTEAKMSFRDFVMSGVTVETDNWQVRCLAGDDTTPFGHCDHSLLDCAKDHVARDFALAGLSERFDESVILLTRTLGWRWPYYFSLNRAPERAPDLELSARDRSAIEPYVALDQELYAYAQHCFDRRVNEIADVQSELLRLRRRNAVYGAIGSGMHRLKRQVARGRLGRLLDHRR
jgi:hypothetical protein